MYERDDPEKQQDLEVSWWCNNYGDVHSIFYLLLGSVKSDNKKVHYITYLLILKACRKCWLKKKSMPINSASCGMFLTFY